MFPWNFSPLDKGTLKQLKQMKPEDVEKFVQEIMEKTFPTQMQGMMNPHEFMKNFHSEGKTSDQNEHKEDNLQSSVFETHDFVFVMIPIVDENWLKQMKLFYTSNQLIIEHIPKYEDKNTIILPSIVQRRGTKARYKDGVLEIKIPKEIDMQFSEIDVSESF